jgi:exonuclease VII small subunit
LKSTQDQLAQLNTQLVAGTSKKSSIESESLSLAAQIEAKSMENGKLNESIKSLERTRDATKATLAQLQQQNDSLQKLQSEANLSTEQQKAIVQQAAKKDGQDG